MRFEAVAFLEHRRDPALRPARRALAERALGDHRDLVRLGEIERRGQPGRARSDDEDVGGRCSRGFLRGRRQAEEHVLKVRDRASKRRRSPRPSAVSAPSTWPAFTLSLR